MFDLLARQQADQSTLALDPASRNDPAAQQEAMKKLQAMLGSEADGLGDAQYRSLTSALVEQQERTNGAISRALGNAAAAQPANDQ